jgi:hypothetical protein
MWPPKPGIFNNKVKNLKDACNVNKVVRLTVLPLQQLLKPVGHGMERSMNALEFRPKLEKLC